MCIVQECFVVKKFPRTISEKLLKSNKIKVKTCNVKNIKLNVFVIL